MSRSVVNQILTIGVELVSASDRKQYLNLGQLIFLRRTHAITKSCHNRRYYLLQM